MSGRGLGIPTLVAALLGAVALRRLRGRRLTNRMTAAPPSVRTDDGVRLHVEVDGPDDAPVTVVFVHGFAARAEMFDPQWSALRGHARLVRYDQRGHGRSGWGTYRSATPGQLGRDLATVVDALAAPGPVVVVGHSMGGMAVLALTGRRPELVGGRIAGVALLSTLAAPLAGAGRSAAGAGLPVRTALASAGAWLLWLAAPLLHLLHPFRSAPGRRLLRRRLFAGDPPEEAVGAMTQAWIRTPATVMSAYLPGLARYDQRKAVDAVRAVPVLVLAGTEDATIPAAAAERLAEHIGGSARLVLVRGAGHMVTLTHPADVNGALKELLARVGTSTEVAGAHPRICTGAAAGSRRGS